MALVKDMNIISSLSATCLAFQHNSLRPRKGRISMSYVAPAVKDKFETLSVELKNAILARNVEINTIHDLINVLDQIVKEAEQEEDQ